MKSRIAVICFFVSTMLLFGFLPSKTWINEAFKQSGYYFIFAAFFFWVLRVAGYVGSKGSNALSRQATGLFLALVASLVIFNISPPQFKILNDEPALLSTSKAMYESRLAVMEYDNFLGNVDYAESIDKRPLFFPFLISLLHSCLGYSASNAFILNFLCCWASIFCFYLLIQYQFSRQLGYLSILLFASMPINAYWYTAGGGEGLNTLFIILTFLFLLMYLKENRTDLAELLLLTLILLSQIRYESLVFLLLIPIFPKYLLKSKNVYSFSVFWYLYPLLMIPVIWQRRYFLSEHLSNVIGITPIDIPEGSSVFDLGNFAANFVPNSFTLSGMLPEYGFSPLICFLSLIGVYLCIRTIVLKKVSITYPHTAFLLYGVCTFSMLILIVFSYYWGDFTETISNRLALFTIPYFLFLSIWAIDTMQKALPANTSNTAITVFFVFHFFLVSPFLAKPFFYSGGKIQKEYYDTLNFLDSIQAPRERILVIAENPFIYSAHSYHAIHFDYANEHVGQLRASMNQNYEHVYVFQRYSVLFNRLYPRFLIDKTFQLNKIVNVLPKMSSYLAISEVLEPPT